jgi:hypothetical protein
MKTLKFSIILCIVLALICSNANAQKPLVENHDEFIYTIEPSPDLPCLNESIAGNIVMDGFFTNSSRGLQVFNYNYHEKGVGVLSGMTTGEYEISWVYNEKDMSFDNGFPKNIEGQAHTNIRHNGKLFMTINWQYHYIWNEPWTYPIVWREVFKPECK